MGAEEGHRGRKHCLGLRRLQKNPKCSPQTRSFYHKVIGKPNASQNVKPFNFQGLGLGAQGRHTQIRMVVSKSFMLVGFLFQNQPIWGTPRLGKPQYNMNTIQFYTKLDYARRCRNILWWTCLCMCVCMYMYVQTRLYILYI